MLEQEIVYAISSFVWLCATQRYLRTSNSDSTIHHFATLEHKENAKKEVVRSRQSTNIWNRAGDQYCPDKKEREEWREGEQGVQQWDKTRLIIRPVWKNQKQNLLNQWRWASMKLSLSVIGRSICRPPVIIWRSRQSSKPFTPTEKGLPQSFLSH